MRFSSLLLYLVTFETTNDPCLCLCFELESSSTAAVDDQQKVSDELRKDASELGIEVIDQISAAAGT
jgi:hypothetical protein